MSLLGIIKKTAAVFTAAVLVTLNVLPAEAMSAYVPLLESPAVRSIPLEENAVQFRSLENAGVFHFCIHRFSVNTTCFLQKQLIIKFVSYLHIITAHSQNSLYRFYYIRFSTQIQES